MIDHGSSDATQQVASRFGARVLQAIATIFETQPYLQEPTSDWLLCLQATESLSEALEASIFEWKLAEHKIDVASPVTAFSVAVMEEADKGWILAAPETRLVHRASASWQGWKPKTKCGASILPGYLMRLRIR